MKRSISNLNFAFSISDQYIHYVSVTIKSIIENHRGIEKNIYVLSDVVSERSRKLLDEVVNGDECTHLKIIIVDDTPLRGLNGNWSIYTWYRLLLPQYLPDNVHKVLYLDADVIVLENLVDLFSIDMEGIAVAGCVDPESFNEQTFLRCKYGMGKMYICAGVLLMNLDYWRDKKLSEKHIQYGHNNNDWLKFADQDTINILCCDSKIVLPLRYGIMDFFFEKDRFYHEPYKQQLYDCIKRPAIVHYAGRNPWKRELATTVMQDEWDKYNRMLKHPVKKEYVTKGWMLFKLFIWKVVHFKRQSDRLTKEKILRKFEETQ